MNRITKTQKKYLPLALLVLIFSLVSIFGLSIFTGNNNHSGLGISKASAQEPADINNDNVVNIFDLSTLLSNWGTANDTSDINNDNTVDVFDLSMLLSKWGSVSTGTSYNLTIQAETYSQNQGLQNETTSDTGGGSNVGWITNGDWGIYPSINLTSPVNTISARIATGSTIPGSIEVRLGSTTGNLVATIPVSNTGGWQTWTTINQSLNAPLSGAQTIVLVFRSSSGSDFMNLNWVNFNTDGVITPTPTPTPQLPPVGGWPGPTNTGVPSGTQLTTDGVPSCASGEIQLWTANVSYDGKQFNCPIQIFAENITITNSLVRGGVGVNPWNSTPTASLAISNTEITGEFIASLCDTSMWNDAVKQTGLSGPNITATRLNIHNFGKGVMSNGNFTMNGSWLHKFLTGNCDGGNAATHGDGVFVWPSSNNNLTDNLIDTGDYIEVGPILDGPSFTAAIFLQGDGHSNDVYRHNKLGGGSYIVYAGSNPNSIAQNVDFIDNVFIRSGLIYGAVTAYNSSNGNDWTNNTWDDNGQLVTP